MSRAAIVGYTVRIVEMLQDWLRLQNQHFPLACEDSSRLCNENSEQAIKPVAASAGSAAMAIWSSAVTEDCTFTSCSDLSCFVDTHVTKTIILA